MKNYFKISFLLIVFILGSCTSLKERINERRERREQEIEMGYEEVKKTVFSGLYWFKARTVNPGAGFSPRDITGFNGYLSVEYYDVEIDLPYYGVVYVSELPKRPGIKIEGELENLIIEEKNYRHRVIVKFTVDGENDRYQITMDIASNFDTGLTISSSRRSTISYTGKVYPLEIEEEEEEEKQHQ